MPLVYTKPKVSWKRTPWRGGVAGKSVGGNSVIEEDDAAFTEETYDDEGDVKEKVRCPIHTARDPRRRLRCCVLTCYGSLARGRSQFHCSVRDLLSKGEEDGEETAISRSAPRFTEASRHLMRTLRVLSMN